MFLDVEFGKSMGKMKNIFL